MRTRYLAAALAAAVSLSLSACADGRDLEAGDGDSKQFLAMSFAGADITIWNDTVRLMEPKIEAAGFGFVSDDPQWNAEKQVSDWRAWIQRGDVKAIMGFPVQADAVVPVTAEATEAGITIISYASDWEGAVTGLTVNDYEVARKLATDAATWVEENAAGQASVAIVANRDTDLASARSDGFEDGIHEALPGSKIAALSGPVDRASGYSQANSQLQADPDTKVWICQSDDVCKGVYQALLDSGVAPDDPSYFVGSLDATQETLDFLEVSDSIYRVAYIVTAETLAELNAAMLIEAGNGEPVQSREVIFDRVTGENAAEFRQ